MTQTFNRINIEHAAIPQLLITGVIMKRYHLSIVLLTGMTGAVMAGNSYATDTPKRKSGLWEINMRMEGAPSMGQIQQCIDQNTDNLMQQRDNKIKQDCSVMEIKNQDNKITLHSICKVADSTATTDAVFVGSFDNAYKGDIKTSYNPPVHGRVETSISMEAKWLSACKPGQKAGDVIMPNMKGLNINELMNDPKIKEMMRHQQK
jgi:hypothetical protein